MIKSKEEGGLGLQSAKGKNITLLSKLNWRFYNEKKAPWARVLNLKYCIQRRRGATNANRLSCSHIRAAMKKGMDTFNRGSRWLVGMDSGLNMWQNKWTNGGSLRGLIQGPITREASILEVKDFMMDTGWDWRKIPFDLPLEVKRLIQATPMTLLSRGEDKLAWLGSPKGTFDLKSAYRISMGVECIKLFSAHWIWKVNTLPRIRNFFLEMCP